MSLAKPYQIRNYQRELYLMAKEAQHQVSTRGTTFRVSHRVP